MEIGIMILIIFLALVMSGLLLKICLSNYTKEEKVYKILKRLNSQRYILLNDFPIRANDKVKYIVHIVVSVYGIFIVQSRNYSGVISGTEKSDKWVNIKGSKQIQFDNPMIENQEIIAFFRRALKISSELFVPIVVLPSDSINRVRNSKKVINVKNLKSTILSYETELLSEQKIQSIAGKVLQSKALQMNSQSSHRVVKNLVTPQKYDKNHLNLTNTTCPKCGAKLVTRKGRYGDVIGCSNFPKCDYTIKIDN